MTRREKKGSVGGKVNTFVGNQCCQHSFFKVGHFGPKIGQKELGQLPKMGVFGSL